MKSVELGNRDTQSGGEVDRYLIESDAPPIDHSQSNLWGFIRLTKMIRKQLCFEVADR